MPKIQIRKEHGMTRQEAAERVRGVLVEVQEKYGHRIDRVDWNSTGDGGSGKGTGFKIRFTIGDVAIDVEVDLSFVLSPLKSKVARKIDEKLTVAFAKPE